MSDRYDALERLQRLRESGALTDEEFQAEKRRLLGYDNGPAVERVTEIDVDAAPKSRTPLYVLLGAGGLAIAVAVGVMLGRTAGADQSGASNVIDAPPPAESPSDMNLVQAPPPVQDVRSLPKPEQLGRAFAAAFGGALGQAKAQVEGQTVTYRPADILWIGDRAVLISPAKASADCHACAGTLAVHYLKAAGDKFEVTGSWPAFLPGAGWGAAPKWKLTSAFTAFPGIYAQGGGMGQGHVCTIATLTEFAPGGPVTSGPIRLHYDNEGAVTDDAPKVVIDGRIVNLKKDVSFDISYSGSETFLESWVKQGGKFVLQGGESRVTQC
ncbi:MAG TPA: SHOCT domain-containing protein [Allosphingosinicella sp.]|jgi:hypothetical protein